MIDVLSFSASMACDLKMTTLQHEDTTLHIAARGGYLEILKYLLHRGVDSEIK